MMRSDLRILNWKGEVDFKGRVEYRSNGIWGSICADGVTKSAVNVMCKQMGFMSGKKFNDDVEN